MLQTGAIFSLVSWPSVVITFVVVANDFESSHFQDDLCGIAVEGPTPQEIAVIHALLSIDAVLETTSNATEGLEWPVARVQMHSLVGFFHICGHGWPVIGWQAEQVGAVVFIIVDWRLGGRVHLAVPAPKRVNRKVLAGGQQRQGRHGNCRDGPHIQMGRRCVAITAGLPRRGKEAIALW
jgi:hypothetical protein